MDRAGIGRTAPGDILQKVLPLDVLLGNIVQPLDAANLVNLHNVGVDQCSGSLGLQLESLQISSIVGQFRPEDFHGDAAFQPALLGQIDVGHRPATQTPKQAEVAQGTAGKIGGRLVVGG